MLVFVATWSDESEAWVAVCSVDDPQGCIVTEAPTKEGLGDSIAEAIVTHFGLDSGRTFVIDFVR
jgi:hypothetical protein